MFCATVEVPEELMNLLSHCPAHWCFSLSHGTQLQGFLQAHPQFLSFGFVTQKQSIDDAKMLPQLKGFTIKPDIE